GWGAEWSGLGRVTPIVSASRTSSWTRVASGTSSRRRAARWHGRQVGLRLRSAGGPGAERALDDGARLLRRDPSDHDDRREAGAEDPAMVCSDVVETERLDRRRSRLAERRLDRRQQRRLERPLREVLRALETAGKLRHELCTHRPEVLLGQAGMNHVIRQEGDGTREVVV